eukprot:TRINITY_DN49591_c0_g1_i1.p1 TRINITY_DN49591_c0_g1~~TRINITY_DN49591_c0_g1_i1.p1  ORF type:complete len:633 (+),score=129.76 TRINITY_DN49591_c0_g1_i1:34-1932(+)
MEAERDMNFLSSQPRQGPEKLVSRRWNRRIQSAAASRDVEAVDALKEQESTAAAAIDHERQSVAEEARIESFEEACIDDASAAAEVATSSKARTILDEASRHRQGGVVACVTSRGKDPSGSNAKNLEDVEDNGREKKKDEEKELDGDSEGRHSGSRGVPTNCDVDAAPTSSFAGSGAAASFPEGEPSPSSEKDEDEQGVLADDLVGDEEETFQEELELLCAWSVDDELRVDYPGGIRARLVVRVVPFTAGEDMDRFVCCELALLVPLRYPRRPVQVLLLNSRGLSDEKVLSLHRRLVNEARAHVGEPALYTVLEVARELLTSFNVPVGECAICLLPLSSDAAEETAAAADASRGCDEVARTPCFHVFHTACLASCWQSEWTRQLEVAGFATSILSISRVRVLCPECRAVLPWEDMRQLHSCLERSEAEVRAQQAKVAAIYTQRKNAEEDEEEQCKDEEGYNVEGDARVVQLSRTGAESVGENNSVHGHGRRRRRQDAARRRAEMESQGDFLWVVEVQNSSTAHASTTGRCSIRIVASCGCSEEMVLNDGGGVKTGELVRLETRTEHDLGELDHVEMKNTSAETWRPHWIKVYAPNGKESFIYSRQWVAKGRTQRAYAEVTGSVGLRASPPPK